MILAEIFPTQLAIILLFKFSPHPTSASALLGESRPSIIHIEMNEKTSMNFINLDLWVLTASRLQGSTVMQQCVWQMKFKNVCKFKKRLVKPGFIWSRTLTITAINEWRKRLLACVLIVGWHFEQFYCKQLKNGQLDEMSAKVCEMWTKCVFIWVAINVHFWTTAGRLALITINPLLSNSNPSSCSCAVTQNPRSRRVSRRFAL